MQRVSIVIPMLNEVDHVDHLVSDIAAQDFSGDIEVFVADGGSTDGSAERLEEAAARAGLQLTVLPNPDRWVSPGLNACIERATGDLIVRLDCHSRYPSDFVRRSVEALEETDAWAVGGIADPEGHTTMERAVACALDSPFGGVHWTRHGHSEERVAVDNFYLGSFRPWVFDRVGGFDEGLVRNQDDELNLRIRLAGGWIVLDPAVRAQYVPRGSLKGAFRQYFEYGVWKIPVMLKHRQVLSARSLAPIAFVASLGALGLTGTVSRRSRRLLAAELGLYAAGALVAGAESVARRGESWRLYPRVLVVFPTMHLGYGLGMLTGWLKAACRSERSRATS